jgi:hypothetical protein
MPNRHQRFRNPHLPIIKEDFLPTTFFITT